MGTSSSKTFREECINFFRYEGNELGCCKRKVKESFLHPMELPNYCVKAIVFQLRTVEKVTGKPLDPRKHRKQLVTLLGPYEKRTLAPGPCNLAL